MLSVNVKNKRETGLGPAFDATVRISPAVEFSGVITLDLDEPGLAISNALELDLERCLNVAGLRWVRGALAHAAECVRDGATEAGATFSRTEEEAVRAAKEQAVKERAAAARDAAARDRVAFLGRIPTMTALELLRYLVQDGGADAVAVHYDCDEHDAEIAVAIATRTEDLSRG